MLGKTPESGKASWRKEVTLYLNPKTSRISQKVMWRFGEFQKWVQPRQSLRNGTVSNCY